jgi:DNA-binding response OmpR family regulator
MKTKSKPATLKMEVDRPRILLVDDDPDFRLILRSWLAPHYDTASMSDGDWLLDEAAVFQPDLFILDVNLPGPDGFSLCRKIRSDSRFSRTPILFITGLITTEAFVRHLETGGSGYLTKPLERKLLLDNVKLLLEP